MGIASSRGRVVGVVMAGSAIGALPYLLGLRAQPVQEVREQAEVVNTVRAQRFEIVDEQGRVRVVVGFNEEGHVGLFAPDEKEARVFIGVDRDAQPGLMMQSKDRSASVVMMVPGDGARALLNMESKSGTLGLGTGPDLIAMQARTSAEKGPRIQVDLEPVEKRASVLVVDQSGTPHGLSTDGDVILQRGQR